MINLVGQYHKIKDEIDSAISQILESGAFINGPAVKEFSENLAAYLKQTSKGANSEEDIYVVPCANGTDALQIALMTLGLKPGDEVLVPAFTYVASAEVIGLLGLTPVMIDVDRATFNVTVENLRKSLSSKTRAIIPVHLFGQSCDMEPILQFAAENQLFVIEDNAQAIGAEYTFSNGKVAKTGTMGTIGCTSFFPTKNLGAFGDGGALFLKDANLAEKARMIANHGQRIKYHHSVIGCNSRLDTIQATILNIKLKHLNEYCAARNKAARYYTAKLKEFDPKEQFLETPAELPNSTHVYHQYTLKIKNKASEGAQSTRDALKQYLADHGIPSMIYYPLPLQEQEAFKPITRSAENLSISKELAESVLSLPIDTEITPRQQDVVIDAIRNFFSKEKL